MKNQIVRFMREEDGATALEYGLIAGLIAVALITVLGTFTNALSGLFAKITNALNGISPTAPAAPTTPPT